MAVIDVRALPPRRGRRPDTTRPTRERAVPHQQVSQNAPESMQEELFLRAAALDGVIVGDSLVSVPGARAFHLAEGVETGPPEAFQRGREFAHLHPPIDGSLHMTLPPDVFEEVQSKGWGEPHPISGTMMVFGARDEDELKVVWAILKTSYGYARAKA
jgi:Family of unknown function (DUF5519)